MEKIVNPHFTAETRKEFAFTCKGVDYYQFTQAALPITYTRLRAANDVIAHATELRVTAGILDEFQDMLDVFAGVKTGDARVMNMSLEELKTQIAHHNSILRTRRRLGDNMEAMYLLASIFYFDETEDPTIWDEGYARKKIKAWLGDHEVESFFLTSLPLHTIISQEALQGTMEEYLAELHLVQCTHSLHNLTMLSVSEKNKGTGLNIEFQAEVSKALINLGKVVRQSITGS